ncbi:ATP-binding protein [Candidatus Pacearchaeota archaeon]|nr:ATP-binding protein [Candidatus Pacearchaeota archaeon]
MARYALIGGSCSGKSSVIKEARGRGINVVEEVARGVLEEIGWDYAADKIATIQKAIFFRQLNIEDTLFLSDSGKDLVFMDRGLIDVLVYSKHFLGYVPFEYDLEKLSKRYDGVFALDRVPYKRDAIRIERDEQEANFFHNQIIEEYKRYRYNPIIVPTIKSEEGAPAKRLDFILSKIENGKAKT